MKPQQISTPSAAGGNLVCGELRWEPCAVGQRVSYRRPDGYTVKPFTGPPSKCEALFFRYLDDCRARLRGQVPTENGVMAEQDAGLFETSND